MAIRFLCSNCRKPLEMDDTDAGRDVLCFYCNSRNTVPMQSDPEELLQSASATEGLVTPRKSPIIGIVGLLSSIAMILTLVFIISWGFGKGVLPLTRDPNFQKLPPKQQQTMVQQKVGETAKQPVMRYAYFVMIIFFLVGLGFSIAGVAANSGKKSAIAGLIITLLMLLIVILTSLTTRTRPPA